MTRLTAKIVKKGNSLDKIRSNIRKIDGERVEIGYFEEQGLHNSGLSYSTLMALQEFGTDEIPHRPVFQITAFGNPPQKNARVKSAIRNWSKALLNKDNNKDNSKQLLDTIGKTYQEALLSLFGDTSMLTPNAPLTISLKGRDEPLVDSGELKDNLSYRNSIDKEIKK